MPHPHRPDPERVLPTAAAALLFLLAAAPHLHARLQFAEKQVLPADRILDVLVWLPEGDPGLAPPTPLPADSPDSPIPGETADSRPADAASAPGAPPSPAPGGPWECGALGLPFRLANCTVGSTGQGGGGRSGYLYWAFLNLDARSRRGDLAAVDTRHQAFFDALQRPHLAFRKRGDTCAWIVTYRESYAPAAAGRVACPDLRSALAAVDADLAGRAPLADRGHLSRDRKAVARPGQFLPNLPQVLDLGLEVSAALPILVENDEEQEAGGFTATEERFDFADLAETRIPPLSIRPFLLYRGVVGLRLGYEYARFALENDIRDQISSANGIVLDDWIIHRNTFSAELVIARSLRGESTEFLLGGTIGVAGTDFRETAVYNGRKDDIGDGFLGDTPALLLSGVGQVRMSETFQMGLELGVAFRDFDMNGSGPDPDGSGSEIQIRLTLGGFHRRHFGQAAED